MSKDKTNENRLKPGGKARAKTNISSLSTNLRKLMERAHLSEHELSRRTQIKQPIINRLLSGENQNPKLNTLKPIADYFLLTVSQLIGEQNIETSWKGMTNKEHHAWLEIPIINYSLDKKFQQKSIITECNLTKHAFALYVVDESMAPALPLGSIAIVEPEQKPENNRIVAIKDGNEFIIRSFFIVSNVVCISPLNDKFGSIKPLSKTQEIVGIVVRTIFNHIIT